MTKHDLHRGFTIVELLIVIVVIAILAAVAIVAYNGVQQRARNAKTISAITAWAKAAKLYEAETGDMPANSGCIGLATDYGYGPYGTDGSGYQCRQDSPTYGINVNTSLNNALAKFLNSNFVAPTTTAPYILTADNWYKGAYFYSTTPRRIDFVLEGSGTDCPLIVGMVLNSRQAASTTDTVRCSMRFS